MLNRRPLLLSIVLLATMIVAACGQAGTGPRPAATGAASADVGTTNVASTVVEPDDGAKPIVDFLGQAKTSIDVGVYLLSDKTVIDALKDAKKRGLKVRVMMEEHPFGGGGNNATVFKQLQEAGIDVKWSNPTFRFTHEKIIVVDRKLAAIMTLNLTRSALTKNREFAIVDADPAEVAEVQAIFDADWERKSIKPSDPDLVVSPDNARAQFLQIIGRAQRTLDVYAEEMQDREVQSALRSAAQRGVKVRAIMSPAEAREKDTNKPGRDNIIQGGVSVRLLKKPYIHAKVFLVDGTIAFVGSQNISATSLNLNREMGMIVASPPTIERIQRAFDKDWAAGTEAAGR